MSKGEYLKYLVKFEDGKEVLVGTSWGERDAVMEAQRYFRDWEPLNERIVASVQQVWTDEAPPMPEGCEWWLWKRDPPTGHPLEHKRFRKMVATENWWCPSFEGNYVCVEIIYQVPRTRPNGTTFGNLIRVVVWGGDDTGMEREFTLDQIDEALACYNTIGNTLTGVTFDELLELGLTWA